ncbi:hypothetical protein IU459_34905 [Nocardia amamiensis]|uniref:YCII-related domain-containing protein n=1 Tax=Nocardia amamiensis TaxID=404578 RepID=A0ABS0D1I4_9NOCA|nr:hypothetical protein [Nocardia amamiensis]MBF6302686.1 hypothetical protein [Nocardia amamiensis]
MDNDRLNASSKNLFDKLIHEQPVGRYALAGCAKDGSEGPPPKTPPPPPSKVTDLRTLVQQAVREMMMGQMTVRVKPGSGYLGIERSPLEFVPVGAPRGNPNGGKRAFMVTYQDRGEVDEDSLPDRILDHAMHLRRLNDNGNLEAAAVTASGENGIQILLAETREEAERFASEDPLLGAGYFRGFDIVELLPSWIGDC